MSTFVEGPFVSVVEFSNDGVIHFLRTLPSSLPRACIQEHIRVFLASNSISTALLSSSPEPVCSAELSAYARDVYATIQVACRNRLVLAAVPAQSSWFGVFYRQAPDAVDPARSERIPAAVLAVARETLFAGDPSDTNCGLAAFWRVFSGAVDIAERGRRRGSDEDHTMRGLYMLKVLAAVAFDDAGESSGYLTDGRLRGSEIQRLRAVAEETQWAKVGGLCVLSSDSPNALYWEDMSRSKAMALAWEHFVLHRPRLPSTNSYEWVDGVLRRSWYHFGGLVMCIDTADTDGVRKGQDVDVVSDLKRVRDAAFGILENWEQTGDG